MKKSTKLALALCAALSMPVVASATIYLMKGGKVVASYPDDAVEYITFDAPENPGDPDIPTEYDVDTRSFYLNSNYYGDTQSASGYNYAIQFFDKPVDSKGNLAFDAVYFGFNLKGPEAVDRKNPFIPEGTYTYDSSTEPGGEYRILPSGTSIYDQGTRHAMKKAWLKVSKNNNKWKYEFTAVTPGDTVYHSVYDGVPNAYDQSITWLSEDQHVQNGTVTGYYLDKKQGGDPEGHGPNINIRIAEYGYDAGGWLVKPGNLITMVGRVNMDEKGNILPGEWTIGANPDSLADNSLSPGRCINFLGMATPVGTNIEHWTSADDVEVGLITGGKMTVTNSKGMMTFRYEFTTDRGKKVSGVFSGQIMVDNHPYANSLKLESDYTLDLTDRTAVCRPHSWSKDIQVELYKFDSRVQYMGDRVDLTLVPSNGVLELQPGIYKVAPDANSVGSITAGTYTPQTGVGNNSVFVKYSVEEPGKVLKAAGIKGGQVEVKKNDDGTWTLIYDLLDDQDTPKHIRGTWTGSWNN